MLAPDGSPGDRRRVFGYKTRMEDSRPQSCTACGPWWRLPLLLGLVLAAILWFRGRELREAPQQKESDKSAAATDADASETVSLTIDFGNGRRETFPAVVWHEGMTVADLMRKAPGIEVSQKGTGESAFVTTIGDVSNEGASGKNWLYAVNGQMADRSFAVYSLRPGDQVLWTFAPRQ
jgi:hypothetical protein